MSPWNDLPQLCGILVVTLMQAEIFLDHRLLFSNSNILSYERDVDMGVESSSEKFSFTKELLQLSV